MSVKSVVYLQMTFAIKYLNNYLVWNNFLNYAKESYAEKTTVFADFGWISDSDAYSQIPDLNRVPARYEGAALPGELIWQI